MSASDWQDALSARQLRAILAVMEVCTDAADSGRAYRESVAEAVASYFGVRDVTFFHGATYPDIFADPDPLLTGATARMLDLYHEGWQEKDIFALPEARRIVTRDGLVTLDALTSLPGPQRSYVVDYLNPHDMAIAAAMHMRVADGEVLIGLFDSVRSWDDTDLLALRVLARRLRSYTTSIAVRLDDADAAVIERLTPRQLDVAHLVSDGLSNNEIAQALNLSEQSVKKYLSRIFDTTGLRNRAELTAAVLRRG